mmetsp:Transcript_41370/g.92530  ORF Transcript_41370/g.92530 Transcript_41370/m.92530 type:complete len:410 (+) Transcript_41370:99-1328(+)
MTLRPRNVEEWFRFAPHLLSHHHWDAAMIPEHSPVASVAHSPCPWGGVLVKFSVIGIDADIAPYVYSNVLVRPEVRAFHQTEHHGVQMEMVELHEPGTCSVQLFPTCGLASLGSLLLASMDGGLRNDPVRSVRSWSGTTTLQNLRRDFPNVGDSSLSVYEDGVGKEGLLICRPQEGKFDVIGIFSVPHHKFSAWAAIHLNLLLEAALKATYAFLNGPSVPDLRALDENFYLVLTIQSCKRGLPLIPLVRDGNATVTIAAGERLGLGRWVRFNPELCGSSKFHLSEYIKSLLNSVGEHIDAFKSLDGRKLMPYQCAVRRDQWNLLRRRFIEVFLLQKTAYRRANGGSTAPSLHEDVDPRFAPDLFVNELSLGQLYTGLWSSVAESRVLGFWRFNVEPQMNIKKCFAMQFS